MQTDEVNFGMILNVYCDHMHIIHFHSVCALVCFSDVFLAPWCGLQASLGAKPSAEHKHPAPLKKTNSKPAYMHSWSYTANPHHAVHHSGHPCCSLQPQCYYTLHILIHQSRLDIFRFFREVSLMCRSASSADHCVSSILPVSLRFCRRSTAHVDTPVCHEISTCDFLLVQTPPCVVLLYSLPPWRQVCGCNWWFLVSVTSPPLSLLLLLQEILNSNW